MTPDLFLQAEQTALKTAQKRARLDRIDPTAALALVLNDLAAQQKLLEPPEPFASYVAEALDLIAHRHGIARTASGYQLRLH